MLLLFSTFKVSLEIASFKPGFWGFFFWKFFSPMYLQPYFWLLSSVQHARCKETTIKKDITKNDILKDRAPQKASYLQLSLCNQKEHNLYPDY